MAKKTRFVSKNELQKIELGDGDWIKVPLRLSYAMLQELAIASGKNGEDDNGNIEGTAEGLASLIKEWNLKDADDKDVEVTVENVKLLDVKTINLIAEKTANLFGDPKAEKKGKTR